MPGMDGFQLCMRWRRDPKLAAIPLVFYTSMFTSAADERFALRLGADALLTKPVDGDVLLDTLEAAAAGALSPARPSSAEEDEFDVFSEYTQRIVDRLEAKVTELNETNEMLMQANEMASALVECSPLGVALLDAECNVRLWSPAAERVFGWTPDETVGDLQPARPRATRASRRRCASCSSPAAPSRTSQLPRLRSDGSSMVLSLSAAPVMDGDDRPAQILTLFGDVSERTRNDEELERAVHRLERAMDASVHVISKIVEKRDPYTAGHEERVARLAVAIGERMGLGGEKLRELHTAGQLHDVGKVSVPTEILSKPGKLTGPEWEMIKLHPLVGVEILETVDLGWPLAAIVGQHHERLDGSGYPDGLREGGILLEARILAVADVVEAMSSHRPYRPARGHRRGALRDHDEPGRALRRRGRGRLRRRVRRRRVRLLTPSADAARALSLPRAGAYNALAPAWRRRYSSVAQLAEHPAVNRRVVGSSPTRGANEHSEAPSRKRRGLFASRM